MPKRMENKIVLVSGAGSIGPGWGNGKACSVLYAREGAKVSGYTVCSTGKNEVRVPPDTSAGAWSLSENV